MKKMAVLLAMAMVTMATAATADALTLTVSNDGINWQTITDNGIGDIDTNSGLLTYTTQTLAGFSTVSVSGATNSTPQGGALFTNTYEVSGGPATLYVKLSDFPYNLGWATDTGAIATTGLTMQFGDATANLKTYYGAALMDTANLLANVSLASPGFISMNSTITSLENPFSLTEFLTIESFDSAASQITASLQLQQNAPVPEPGTMALLGIGIFGLAIYGKRRQNNSTAAVAVS